MNTQWHERFNASAAKIALAQVDEAGNIGFDSKIAPGVMAIGPLDMDAKPVLVELSRLAVIDVQGVDAAEFLQAQVCNDLTAMSEGQVQINGYCSPKGRLMALFTVFAVPQSALLPSADESDSTAGYRLVLPADVAPAFIKRLQMFIMRAKVTIAHRTDLVCTGVVCPAGAELTSVALPEAFPVLPGLELGLSSNDSVQIYRWHDDTGSAGNPDVNQRFLCIGPTDTLFELWQSEGYHHAALPYWRWGDINAGIPNVFAASADQFIPQMLNMQLINALSFKKGCYPGQEIVARMQYLGKLKKHMKHLHLPGVAVAPEPATTLTTETNNNAGQIVDAIVDEHGLNLLAVVNIETPVSDLLLNGEALQEGPIPYSLKPDNDAADVSSAS